MVTDVFLSVSVCLDVSDDRDGDGVRVRCRPCAVSCVGAVYGGAVVLVSHVT